jgi:hypothetical protein
MKKSDFKGIMLLIVFVWAGMLLGISFLEAPLKFQAPNITLALGLGIGRLVFAALNKIELVFGFSIVVMSLRTPVSKGFKYLMSIVLLLLAVQTLWLLPALDARAENITSGGIPPQSSPHLYYVLLEAVKLLALITIGLRLYYAPLKSQQNG